MLLPVAEIVAAGRSEHRHLTSWTFQRDVARPIRGAAEGATATAVTRWTESGATTAAVTITTIAGDRTPGIGGKAGAASATI